MQAGRSHRPQHGRRNGHRCDGGVVGIKMVREIHPDLVLLDLMMPDMDGWEVYQQMKADTSGRNA